MAVNRNLSNKEEIMSHSRTIVVFRICCPYSESVHVHVVCPGLSCRPSVRARETWSTVRCATERCLCLNSFLWWTGLCFSALHATTRLSMTSPATFKVRPGFKILARDLRLYTTIYVVLCYMELRQLKIIQTCCTFERVGAG